MEHKLSLAQIRKEWHGSYKAYAIGFISSLILTTLSFGLVMTKTSTPLLLVALALLQAVFQLIFFLHLGQEAKPRSETLIFIFMVVILLIVALGSLWIMYDLNERMMPGMTMNHD